jgi:hypothetical protein
MDNLDLNPDPETVALIPVEPRPTNLDQTDLEKILGNLFKINRLTYYGIRYVALDTLFEPLYKLLMRILCIDRTNRKMHLGFLYREFFE